MICQRCIYDDKIPYITFNEDEICNYCTEHDTLEKEYPTGEKGWKILENLAEKMKKDGKGKPYDVAIGVSGGCDSSYLLHLSKELGLRALACHFDNTWNSKVSTNNIRKMTKALRIDLYTHVVNNNEFNDIFRSTLLASVPESDVSSDIALAATHYMACEKYGIKYIFEGHSFRTEGIIPHGITYMDGMYVKSIHDKFGQIKNIDTFPNLWITKWLKWTIFDRIKKIRPIYYIDYNKEEIKKMLTEKYDWEYYGGHHQENRTSYFANNYWLPKKFNIDLRLSEFSALVRCGQMTRDEALENIKKDFDFDKSIIEEIKKRLKLSNSDFELIMSAPNKSYRDYKTYKQTFERLRPLFYVMYKMNLIPKSFYLKYTRRY